MRIDGERASRLVFRFLSIQAQDFIEETCAIHDHLSVDKFLSIQAQDFIEDEHHLGHHALSAVFLSIQAQDFIEESICLAIIPFSVIPEHSSSGLH